MNSSKEIQVTNKDLLPKSQQPSLENKKTISKHANLWKFPTAGRVLGYIPKIFLGVLAGAASIGGIILSITVVHVAISAVLISMAALYTFRTVREIYKAHKKEKKLMKQMESNFHDAMEEFRKLPIGQIEELVRKFQCNPNSFTVEEKQSLYTRLVEYQETLTKLKTLAAAKKKALGREKTDAGIEQFEKFLSTSETGTESGGIEFRLNQCIRDMDEAEKEIVSKTPQYQPVELLNPDFRQTRKKDMNTQNQGQDSPWKKAKTFARKWSGKAAKQLSDFFGGASMGYSVGSCVLTCIVGSTTATAMLSNPIGWVMLTLLGTSAFLGIVAVVINHHVTRGQERKIKRLVEVVDDLEYRCGGVKNIHEHIKNLHKIKALQENPTQTEKLPEIKALLEVSTQSNDCLQEKEVHLPNLPDNLYSQAGILTVLNGRPRSQSHLGISRTKFIGPSLKPNDLQQLPLIENDKDVVARAEVETKKVEIANVPVVMPASQPIEPPLHNQGGGPPMLFVKPPLQPIGPLQNEVSPQPVVEMLASEEKENLLYKMTSEKEENLENLRRTMHHII